MFQNKIIIVLISVCSCLALPDPLADFEMSMHFHDSGGSADHDDQVGLCEHEDHDAMCVMREPYWGDCPPNMHFSPGSCHHPEKEICCKKNPICGNEAQGRCYRKNATTDGCPLPLFRQSTRRSPPCPDHETTCCAGVPDPHCHCDHWGYVGMCGERGWTGICPDFCAGNRQSPINIEEVTHMGIGSWNLTDYDKAFTEIHCENNGHFAVCDFDTSTITPKVSGTGIAGEYIFHQMVFHIGCEDGEGSEHTIGTDHMRYSGEVHLIHYSSSFDNYSMALHSSDSTAIGVLAIFLHVNHTQAPDVWNPFMNNLVYINKRHTHKTFSFGHTLKDLLPENLDSFYTYEGSLTHPSCNEVVQWAIFKEPASIGYYQIQPFRCMMEGHGDRMCDNHRPTQPLHVRKVYEYMSM